MEIGVQATSNNPLDVVPESRDNSLAQNESKSSEVFCERLLSPELIEYSDSFVPQKSDGFRFTGGHSDTRNMADISVKIMQVPQNTSSHGMLVSPEDKASHLKRFTAKSQEVPQRIKTTPITIAKSDTYTYRHGLDDDLLQLRNGDSDWDLVESDNDSECIFPYSPDSTPNSCEHTKATMAYAPQSIKIGTSRYQSVNSEEWDNCQSHKALS